MLRNKRLETSIILDNSKGVELKPRGTKDIFGRRKDLFLHIEKNINHIANCFNFNPIETPTFEFKNIYTKTVGKESDIVSKEMYVFKDKKQREFALRPEGTAGIVRAVIENKLLPKGNNYLKLFYSGNFFRYERPQKGRQREFHQVGFETFGPKNILMDLEMILLGKEILDKLKIPYKLQINSLGSAKTRKKWQEALTSYFIPFKNQLSGISIKRIWQNPLRILDDKDDQKKVFVQKAPSIETFYSQEEKTYFENLTNLLTKMQVNFEINPLLVRGLDYYNDTVFEFLATGSHQKAKDTLIGGGRYDKLTGSFSTINIGAIGLGIGLERLVNEIEELNLFEKTEEIDFFVLNLDEETSLYAFEIMQELRNNGFQVEMNLNKPLNFAKGLQKANKLNAKFICIINKDNKEKQSLVIKSKKVKKELLLKNLPKFLKDIKNEENTK